MSPPEANRTFARLHLALGQCRRESEALAGELDAARGRIRELEDRNAALLDACRAERGRRRRAEDQLAVARAALAGREPH